jgi:hypothetical protein
VVGAVPIAWCSRAAFAAHPFITEDPGTVGTGRIELELGTAAGQGDPSLAAASGVRPQLSLGTTPAFDLIAIGMVADACAGLRSLAADTLRFKWRFSKRYVGARRRAGLDLPTGDSIVGLGAGTLGYHAIASRATSGLRRTRTPPTQARANPHAAKPRPLSIALTRPDDAPLRPYRIASFTARSNQSNGRRSPHRTHLQVNAGWMSTPASRRGSTERDASGVARRSNVTLVAVVSIAADLLVVISPDAVGSTPTH